MERGLTRLSIVYIAKNIIDGKFYIGVTMGTLAKRKREHFHAARAGIKSRFYNAIRKHGAENFAFSVLDELPNYQVALSQERLRIAEMEPPYNFTKGGEGNLVFKMPLEIRARLAEKQRGSVGYWRGKKRPQETIDKMRLAKLTNPTRYWLGRKRSPETIAKIVATKTNVKRTNKSVAETEARKRNIVVATEAIKKPVVCLNDSRWFSSARDASVHYGFCKTSVAAVACGRRKQVCGLKFEYAGAVS